MYALFSKALATEACMMFLLLYRVTSPYGVALIDEIPDARNYTIAYAITYA